MALERALDTARPAALAHRAAEDAAQAEREAAAVAGRRARLAEARAAVLAESQVSPEAVAAWTDLTSADGIGPVLAMSLSDAFANAREAYNSRWTTSSNPDFDTSTANLTKRNWFERQLSRLPGGKDPTDLKWVDANGNEDWTGREAIGDEAPETYAQRRARNLELQRRSKGTN